MPDHQEKWVFKKTYLLYHPQQSEAETFQEETCSIPDLRPTRTYTLFVQTASLLRRYSEHTKTVPVGPIIRFTEQIKLFTIAAPVNLENKRLYSISLASKKDNFQQTNFYVNVRFLNK